VKIKKIFINTNEVIITGVLSPFISLLFFLSNKKSINTKPVPILFAHMLIVTYHPQNISGIPTSSVTTAFVAAKVSCTISDALLVEVLLFY
jgi:hypothetical protein